MSAEISKIKCQEINQNKSSEKSFFVSTIEKTHDLYVGGDGGPFSKSNFIEITNNNPEQICFKIYCESLINSNSGACWPNYKTIGVRDYNLCVNGNSKEIEEIVMNVHIIPETIEGSYNANVKIELVKYYDEVKQEDVFSSQSLKAYPITINAHNLRN